MSKVFGVWIEGDEGMLQPHWLPNDDRTGDWIGTEEEATRRARMVGVVLERPDMETAMPAQENVTKTILSEDATFSILGELCRLPDPEGRNGMSERNGKIRQLGWSHEALRAENARLREALGRSRET